MRLKKLIYHLWHHILPQNVLYGEAVWCNDWSTLMKWPWPHVHTPCSCPPIYHQLCALNLPTLTFLDMLVYKVYSYFIFSIQSPMASNNPRHTFDTKYNPFVPCAVPRYTFISIKQFGSDVLSVSYQQVWCIGCQGYRRKLAGSVLYAGLWSTRALVTLWSVSCKVVVRKAMISSWSWEPPHPSPPHFYLRHSALFITDSTQNIPRMPLYTPDIRKADIIAILCDDRYAAH